MSHTGDVLFQAMCEQPWDVSRRLAYADWLADHGQPQWAGFVRYQCRAFEHSLNRFQAYYCVDMYDEIGQFDPFESVWRKGLPTPRGVTWSDSFKGGFIHCVCFHSAAAFKEHAATVFAASPVDMVAVERLTDRSIQDILGSPLLGRLEWLSLYGARLGDEGMRRLAGCLHLARLKNLLVEGLRLGDGGAVAIAGSAWFAQLERLYFFGNHGIGDRGASALADSLNLTMVNFLALNAKKRLSQPVVEKLKRRFQYLDGWPTQS
jgi:uncharacterized protein (TIGR02996 family)